MIEIYMKAHKTIEIHTSLSSCAGRAFSGMLSETSEGTEGK